MGMSLALWMWNANSFVPSALRYASIHALILTAWPRRSSSARPASRSCSWRSRMNPTTNAPTVPSAENTLAAALMALLSKVRTLPTGEVVPDPHAHRPVHRKSVDRGRWHPVHLAGLVARRRLAAHVAAGEHDGELLPGL